MTADEIISLVFEYEHAADGDSTAAAEAAEVNFKTAIHQVVEERDEALKSLSEILDACSFSPAELEETMTSLRIERDQARDECERMRKESR